MTRLLTLTLALLIAVTSQQMAVARGVMVDTAGHVVLCTGQGTITVTLDAQGNVTEGDAPAHFCPDCALTLADLPQVNLVTHAGDIHMQMLAQTPVHQLEIPVIPSLTLARGPPLNA